MSEVGTVLAVLDVIRRIVDRDENPAGTVRGLTKLVKQVTHLVERAKPTEALLEDVAELEDACTAFRIAALSDANAKP